MVPESTCYILATLIFRNDQSYCYIYSYVVKDKKVFNLEEIKLNFDGS